MLEVASTKIAGAIRVEARIIRASRWKAALLLAVCALFVAGGLAMVAHPDGPNVSRDGWLSVGFFGLGVAVFTWLIVRPQTMRLDAEGLTLDGGLLRQPQRLLWRDVEKFKVLHLPKGGTLLGFT